MGRRQYLERLALGRSAYGDVESAQPSRPATAVPNAQATPQEVTGHEYTQQYDARGRPINPAINRFNAEQRKAQNEVLALVGVVERKDETDHINGLRYTTIQKARRALLAEEHDRGEIVEYAAFASCALLQTWPGALRHRYQVGLYETSRSFLDTLAAEWHQPLRGGTRWFLARLFPGAASTITHHVLRFALTVVAEQIDGELQTRINKKGEKRNILKYLEPSTAWIFEALLLAIDIAILPLEYYAATQMLGLAPALPLLPSFKFCLPGSPGGFHSFGWNGVIGNRFFQKFTSPAAFLLMRKMVAYDAADSVLPVFHLITDFRFPDADADPTKVVAPKLKKDPFGWLLYQCYSLRSRFLKRSGWNLIKRNDTRRTREDEHEMLTRACVAGEAIVPIHRSTMMAQLPAQFLSEAIDGVFARTLFLPFEALMMRTIAASFMSSSATHPIPMLYPPFGGGPLSSGWAAFGQYAGHIGLSLALATSVDVVLFFGVYKFVRRLGTTYFDWGRRGKIGHCIYTEEGMEEFASQGGIGSQLERIH